MKYGIVTSGSRGDVQPFIALALAMMERGHDVAIVGPENFRGFVEGFGVPNTPVTGDSEQIPCTTVRISPRYSSKQNNISLSVRLSSYSEEALKVLFSLLTSIFMDPGFLYQSSNSMLQGTESPLLEI